MPKCLGALIDDAFKGAEMIRTLDAACANRWLVVLLAAMTVAGCDGGPATVATGATSISSSASIGAATLSWVPPSENTDGSALTDLAGYRIYYGTGPNSLTEVVDVPTVGISDFVIDHLTAGTYYFSIRAYTAAGIESALSNVVSDTIG